MINSVRFTAAEKESMKRYERWIECFSDIDCLKILLYLQNLEALK